MKSVLAGASQNSSGSFPRASTSAFLTTLAAGQTVAELSRPFGAGTVLSVVGATPPQLAFSSGRITRGAGAAVSGQTYSIRIRAESADGKRAIERTLDFTAIAPIVISGSPPDATVGLPYEHIFTANGPISISAPDLAALAAFGIQWDAAARRLYSSNVLPGA